MELIPYQGITELHQSGHHGVIAITGGGSRLISWLLSVPGGSKTVLEAIVPYSQNALRDWIGRSPDQACSQKTALEMAARAYQRAQQLDPGPHHFGLGITAALISHRMKRGPHRVYAARQDDQGTLALSLVLEKGARTREEEEEVAAAAGFFVLASDYVEDNTLILNESEIPILDFAPAEPEIRALRQGSQEIAWRHVLDEGLPALRGLLCGSFDPLHFGHQQLRSVSEKRLGGAVGYELSLRNADKPPLDDLSIRDRLRQDFGAPVALTMAPTFVEKARLFPGCAFIVGADTAVRILDPRFYKDGDSARALAELAAHNCRFLIAARNESGRSLTRQDLVIPPGFEHLFEEISSGEFLADVSSTELRRQRELEAVAKSTKTK